MVVARGWGIQFRSYNMKSPGEDGGDGCTK